MWEALLKMKYPSIFELAKGPWETTRLIGWKYKHGNMFS
jgi:hypothetical protein